jgi:hypothetical protein
MLANLAAFKDSNIRDLEERFISRAIILNSEIKLSMSFSHLQI